MTVSSLQSRLGSTLLPALRLLASAHTPYLALLFYPPSSLSLAHSFRSLPFALACRASSSQALRSFDSAYAADEVGRKKRGKVSAAWDQAAEAFFSSRDDNGLEDSSNLPFNAESGRQRQQLEGERGLSRPGKALRDRNEPEPLKRRAGRGSFSKYDKRRAPNPKFREEAFKRTEKTASRFEASGLENQLVADVEERHSPRRRSFNLNPRSIGRREEVETPSGSENDRREWRKEPSSHNVSLSKVKGDLIYGVGPIHAALQISRREFFCLYVQENMPIDGGTGKRKDKRALEWILRSAIGKAIEVKEVSKHDLNLLVDNRPHQGLVLDASPLELVPVSELEVPFEENDRVPVWVALDEVTDPQNYGAILRSAYFLGASGVVVCSKNSAPLSGVVSKASAGALEVMEIRSCRNMVKFLDKSIENGWRVVGAAAAGRAVVPVRKLPCKMATILVLGSEGRGLRTNVRRACHHLVCVPGLASKRHLELCTDERFETDADQEGPDEDQATDMAYSDEVKGEHTDITYSDELKGEHFVAVESLNVSVAAGILLHELLNGLGSVDS